MSGNEASFLALLAVVAVLPAAVAANAPPTRQLLPSYAAAAAAIVAHDQAAPPPLATPQGILLRSPAVNGQERIYWDIPLSRIPAEATTLLLESACSAPAAVRAVTLHLKSGHGWLTAELPPPTTTNMALSATAAAQFASEGAPSAWHKARLLRLSLWLHPNAAIVPTITLRSVAARHDVVAIVRATAATAPGVNPFWMSSGTSRSPATRFTIPYVSSFTSGLPSAYVSGESR